MAGFMGFNLANKSATIFGDGSGRWSTTTLGSIGLAVKNALLIPEKTANQYLHIHSFNVSQNDCLSSFEKATGCKWDTTRVDAEQQKREGMQKLAAGDFSGAMALIRFINTQEGHGGNYATYQPCANELLSLPSQSVDRVIADIVKG